MLSSKRKIQTQFLFSSLLQNRTIGLYTLFLCIWDTVLEGMRNHGVWVLWWKGEEFDIFLYPSVSAPSRVLQGIQRGEKDFSSLVDAKEKMKRHRVQEGEGRMND